MHFRAVCFALLTAACASWAVPAEATTYILTGVATGTRQPLEPILLPPSAVTSVPVELDFVTNGPISNFGGLALISPIVSATFQPQGGLLVDLLFPANSYFAVGLGAYAGRAGFGVSDGVSTLDTYIGFGAPGLAGYDGVSSFGPISVTVDQIDPFQTLNTALGIKAGWNFTSFSNATFSAIAGVPEPATWAMFLLGFGAIGWTLRSRRQERAVA